jgi:hypothetical protein
MNDEGEDFLFLARAGKDDLSIRQGWWMLGGDIKRCDD